MGAGVQGLSPGDEVYFLQCGFGARSGTYGEWAVVDAALVALKPSSLSMQQAGAAPLVLIAAWESVYGHGALQPGQRVLVHGGAGGVGHIAIQLARLRGARVCTTVSTAEKAALAASVGADEVIYYREENFNLAILDWSEEDGVDLALDTVGGQTFEHSFTAVRCYGNLVTLQQPPARTNWTVARQRNLKIGLEMVLTPIYLGMEQEMHRQGQILRDCARLIDEGRLRIHLDREFALDAAAEAHRCLEAGEARGKLALGVI
jgi:NADPH2:quinone reductase